jgi:hypothetical protein
MVQEDLLMSLETTQSFNSDYKFLWGIKLCKYNHIRYSSQKRSVLNLMFK